MPFSESFISEETVEHTSHHELSLKECNLPSIWKSLSSSKRTPALSAIFLSHDTRSPHQVKDEKKISENTLPFERLYVNTFSGGDISQSVDWDRPSLPPHFLLVFSYSFINGICPNNSFRLLSSPKQVRDWNYFTDKDRKATNEFISQANNAWYLFRLGFFKTITLWTSHFGQRLNVLLRNLKIYF